MFLHPPTSLFLCLSPPAPVVEQGSSISPGSGLEMMEPELHKWKHTDCTRTSYGFLFSKISLVGKVSRRLLWSMIIPICASSFKFPDPPGVNRVASQAYLSETRASQINFLLSISPVIHHSPDPFTQVVPGGVRPITPATQKL